MKVDRDGRVYVAVAQGVWVFEPRDAARHHRAAETPGEPRLVRPRRLALAITAVDAVYPVRLKVPGVLPPFTPDGPGSCSTTSRSPTAWRSRPTSKRFTSATPRAYHVRAFSVEPSGDLTPGSGRVFAPALDPGQPGGPDGMKVDRDGRVYVAVALGVWVFEVTGKLLGDDLASSWNAWANAWCDPDGSRLVITAIDTVYSIRMKVKGVLPPFTPGIGRG